jgi:hypothetical protein
MHITHGIIPAIVLQQNESKLDPSFYLKFHKKVRLD